MPGAGIDDSQRWAFECAGFALIPRMIDAALVARLREAAASFASREYTQISPLLGKQPAFAEALFHPTIEAVAEQFFGRDFRLGGSVLVVNPAQARGYPLPQWHRDNDHPSYAYHAVAWPCPLFQLRTFIALSPVLGPESGGFALFPGSHRAQGRFPFSTDQVPPGAAIPVMQPGDCMIMHHATFHTALMNTSAVDRYSLQVLHIPSWIRSREFEQATPDALATLTGDQRARLASASW